MKRRQIVPHIGDVFLIPVDGDRVSFGQIVGKYVAGGYYFAIFERTYARTGLPSLPEAIDDRLLLLALSLDAKIAVGDWTVVGNAPVAEAIPLPAFKESVDAIDNVEVVDYSGARRRPATPEEAERVPHRSVVSPAFLEETLRAKHGLQPWSEEFEGLEPDEANSSRRLFDEGP